MVISDHRFLEEVVLEGKGASRRSRSDVQLTEDIAHVPGDGSFTDDQLGADFSIGLASGN
jgi:hypothetical protein